MTPTVLAAGAAAASSTPPDVPLWVTTIFAGLLVGLVLCLAFEEKIHAKKSLIAGVFAVISLFLGDALGLLPVGDVVNIWGQHLHLPVWLQGVDWPVIGIILGSSLFVDVASGSGLFTWIAVKLTKASGGDPYKLLWSYGVMTVVFSAVLNNVTAMIIVGSLTAVSLDKLDRRDKLLGFLLTEGLLTNIGGLLTLISSVPNIIVGTTAGISFMKFFVVAAPFVVVATVVTILLAAKQFGITRLADDAARARATAQVAGFDENEGLSSRAFFSFSAVMTLAFIVCIAGASALPVLRDLGMAFVACAFAVIMLVRYKSEVDRFYRAVDWDLLGFFAGLFIVINVMEHAQVLALIGRGLEHVLAMGDLLGSGVLLVASAGFSSVTDNIPLAAMLAKILGGLGTPGDSAFWWSVIFGANLGGNITPIGSASTLVAVTIIHKNKLPMTFAGFVKAAVPYAAVQIVLATAYLLVFLR